MHGCGGPWGAPIRPAVELADIVREHGDAFRRDHALSTDQHAVLRAIERCRTAVLGGHLDVCLQCGRTQPSYNSCRNRHCPKCQSLAQARWVSQRMARVQQLVSPLDRLPAAPARPASASPTPPAR